MPFYAVKAGWSTGIFESWPECQEQVKGFSSAKYKKFSSIEQAQEFINGSSGFNNSTKSFDTHSRKSNSSTSTYDSSSKSSASGFFYAVSNGRKTGIFHSWSDCEAQVKGFPNPKFRKFANEADAIDFVQQGAASSSHAPQVFRVSPVRSCKASANIHPSTAFCQSGKTHATSASSTMNQTQGIKRKFHMNKPMEEKQSKKHKGLRLDTSKPLFSGSPFPDSSGTHVYTDGGCFDNGKNGARAGIGVFWNHRDSDNVSERLLGRQTNNRAEIHAAVRAIEKAKRKDIRNLILHTDSQFMINGITKWIKGWKKNGWILTSGEPVVNREDFEQLDRELRGINVKWVYVKGHSGDPGNDAVDLLAKQGAAKPPV